MKSNMDLEKGQDKWSYHGIWSWTGVGSNRAALLPPPPHMDLGLAAEETNDVTESHSWVYLHWPMHLDEQEGSSVVVNSEGVLLTLIGQTQETCD